MTDVIRNRLFQTVAAMVLALGTQNAFADKGFDSSYNDRSANTVEVLVNTNGAEALVGAVLYVEGANVLDFSLVEFLSTERYILFAPSNNAFEALLGLAPGALAGLSAEEIAHALEGLVAADAVAGILLKHVVPDGSPRFRTETALLRAGSATAADGTELVVGIGAKGVEVKSSTITKANVTSRNSIIHFIDTVIL